MQTKEYIITNATELFNRQGVTTTSLRQLAAHLEMSDGNLRYHFKNKEVLVMDIFRQMLWEMSLVMQTAEKIGEQQDIPGAVKEQLQVIFYIMYQYRFLFKESSLLLQQYEIYRDMYLELMATRKSFFIELFTICKAKGLMAEPFTDHHFQLLFEQIFIISDNWIKYLELDATASLDEKINHYISLCLSLMFPVMEKK